MFSEDRGWFALFSRASRLLIHLLLIIAGASILAAVALVTVDVILRKLGYPFKGSVDIVSILGALAVACALPYTTAVKGHVAIEFFFQKLPRRGRLVLDTITRLMMLVLFLALTWQSIRYGLQLRANHQVTPTLQIPVFWVSYLFAASFAVVVLVKIYHLLRPGKTMIQP